MSPNPHRFGTPGWVTFGTSEQYRQSAGAEHSTFVAEVGTDRRMASTSTVKASYSCRIGLAINVAVTASTGRIEAGFMDSSSTVDRSYSCRIGPIDLCPVYLMLIRFWLIHRTDAIQASGSRRWMLPIIIEGDGKETNEVPKITKIRSLQVCLWRKSE